MDYQFKRILSAMRFLILVMTTSLISGVAGAQQANSPFEYKKPAPPVEQAQVVHSDMDLTAKQRDTVMAMINAVADTLRVTPEKDKPFEMDGKRYLLLQSGQVYLGKVNGNHVVFDDVAKEYSYHSVEEISKIIRGDEFERMKQDAASELEKLQQSLMQGAAGSATVPTQPAEIYVDDAKKQRTQAAGEMVGTSEPIIITNPIADKGN